MSNQLCFNYRYFNNKKTLTEENSKTTSTWYVFLIYNFTDPFLSRGFDRITFPIHTKWVIFHDRMELQQNDSNKQLVQERVMLQDSGQVVYSEYISRP